MAINDPQRDALHVQIQTLVAGHPVERVLPALGDSLAAATGFAAEDIGHADQLIDALADEMKKAIRRNWDEIRTVRATASAGASGSA